MKGYGQFCPVALASEVFAQRWTPLILRELLAGPARFNALMRGLPAIPRSTLVERLQALEAAGVVGRGPGGGRAGPEYRLTAAGLEFAPAIEALGTWGQRWAARFDPHNLDAEFLMWNLQRRLDAERLPADPTVVHFAFSGLPSRPRRARLFWLVLAPPDPVELCLKDPGRPVDLQVAADLGAFARVWLGDLAMADALHDGRIALRGPPALVQAFPGWLRLSRFADVPHPAAA